MEEDRVMAEAGEVTEAVAQVMVVREADLVEAAAEVMVAVMEVKKKICYMHIIYFDLVSTNMSYKD